MSEVINPYTRQPYSEFSTRYLPCGHCGEARLREGDGETICDECAAIFGEDGGPPTPFSGPCRNWPAQVAGLSSDEIEAALAARKMEQA